MRLHAHAPAILLQRMMNGGHCCREALLHVAAWGPAAGAAASLLMLLAGFGISAAGVPGGAVLEPGAFQDSLLVGLLGECRCCALTTPASHAHTVL